MTPPPWKDTNIRLISIWHVFSKRFWLISSLLRNRFPKKCKFLAHVVKSRHPQKMESCSIASDRNRCLFAFLLFLIFISHVFCLPFGALKVSGPDSENSFWNSYYKAKWQSVGPEFGKSFWITYYKATLQSTEP